MKRIFQLSIILFFIIILVHACKKEDPIQEPTKFTVNITLNPSEGGNISPFGGQYIEGQSVSFSAVPKENYNFKNWTGAIISSDNPINLIMDGNKNLTANFEKKDTDGDGKTDDIDNCSNTPIGEIIDEFGCSDSQKDTDGDGVMNNVDQCPETPSGEIVDENGCSGSQIFPTQGLVSYYPFYGNALDVSGHGNHGTVEGAILIADKDGIENNAYAFNGNSDLISINLNSIDNKFDENVDLSINVWFNNNDSDGAPLVAFTGEETAARLHLGIGFLGNGVSAGGRLGVTITNDTSVSNEYFYVFDDTRVTNHGWFMATLVRKSSTGVFKLYRNGNLVRTSEPDETGKLTFSPKYMAIGCDKIWVEKGMYSHVPQVRYFTGFIDNVGIWERALSDIEIKYLYDNYK